jgi:ABC-type transport system substrate-binding protein
MKKTGKLLALLLALAMIVSVFAACSSSDSGTTTTTTTTSDASDSSDTGSTTSDSSDGETASAVDHTLVIGVTDNPNGTHDPTTDSVPRYQNETFSEKLMNLNPDTGEWDYQLATNIEYVDDLLIKVELRDDVYFTDGQHMTSKDVFYTFKDWWGGDSAQCSYFVSFDWDNSYIEDDYTIYFALSQEFGPAITYLCSYTIYCYDDIWGDNPADADKWMLNPNGTGPYYCVENVDSSYVTYVRKDAEDYWGELPECEQVTFRYYSETSAMYIDFENGVLDVACGLNAQDAARVLDGDLPDFAAYQVLSARDNTLLILSEGKEIWDDINVRKAFAMSLDCESVATAMYGVLFQSADSILPSTVAYYESQGTYEYDPEAAKQLLIDAGYPDGVDLNLVVTSQYKDLAEALQASVAQAGFNVTVESYDWTIAVPMMREGASDFIIKESPGGAFSAEPGQLLDTLSPDSTLPPAALTDPEWVEYFNMGAYSSDDATREAGYVGMQRYAYESVRVIALCERSSMTVYNKEKLSSFNTPTNDSPTVQYARFN